MTHQVATTGLSARRGGWARRLSRRFRWQWLLFAALGALLFVLTIVQLLTVLLSSLRPAGLPLSDGWTLEHYRAIWQSPYTYDLVLNSGRDSFVQRQKQTWGLTRTGEQGS